MSRITAAACFIGVIVMSMATLRAGPAQDSLRVGDRLPVLKGQFLSGRDAELPRASSGNRMSNITIDGSYFNGNAQDVLDVLWPYAPKLVLQGHTHIRETVMYNGRQFITTGAVCGNWWKGPRDGHPEGFGVVTVRGADVSWRYETYGFTAGPI